MKSELNSCSTKSLTTHERAMRLQRPKEADVNTRKIEEADSKAVAKFVKIEDGVEAEDDLFTNVCKNSGKRNIAVYQRNTRIRSRIIEGR